jgi:hypothetical protein
MTVEQEVANLTTAVDNLTAAVDVSKATLDASVADSEAARNQSQAARDTANLHKLAAEAAATSATNTASSLTGFDLAAIAATKAETAVDVFVYDTANDSDGGAWRKRTQNTSWYQETLNTATRGARREFPAVAVIVAEASKVTIYDGDDPALPMWMVFNGGTFNAIRTTVSSIVAQNGYICVGHNAGNSLNILSFLEDTVRRHWSTSQFSGFYLGDIAKRNSSSDFSGFILNPIVNTTVNDVAMTVLPDAPIDPATGLPVPTIAVATAGGVSVITDSGAVFDIVYTGFGFNSVLATNTRLYATSTNGVLFSSGYPIADVASASFTTLAGLLPNGVGYFSTTTPALLGSVSRVAAFAEAASGSTLGMTLLVEDEATPANSMIARVTSSYNSGYQNGAIRGAFLSDTDDTNLVGSGELVTNGTFDTDISGWTSNSGAGASVAQSNGVVELTTTNSDDASLYQAITTVAGASYVITASFAVVSGSPSGTLRVGTTIGGFQLVNVTVAVGENSVLFTASGTVTYIQIMNRTDGATVASFDNISVKLADADRSVNNKGLIINGTVTRSPVATGADLVAYSGFSASNYLEQPYNSALDFGTGDFAIMGWFNTTSGTTTYIVQKSLSGLSGGDGFFVVTSSGKLLFNTRGGGTSSNATTNANVNSGQWIFFSAVRKNSGTLLEVYLNGALDVSASVVARDVSVVDSKLFVGTRADLSNSFSGSLALLRISATAPTADQIKKIYEDEKFLFQNGAQATLFGASDAVTALGHDPVTDLLHVGTSAGRSVFQGLRRVSNTTTAVGTAISASNGLVVEE